MRDQRGLQPAPVQTTAMAAAEIDFLAAKLADTHLRMVAYYRAQRGMTQEEAEAEASSMSDWHLKRVTEGPLDEVSWWDLHHVAEQDPAQALCAWERMKAAARDELASGQRAASAFEFGEEPWHRAQFLAIRTAFREEWQPRGGIEDALIDTMAQAQTAYAYWMGQLHVHAVTEGTTEGWQLQREGTWQSPRVEVAAWIDQAAAMADRFNRLFLRTLRALRDLRRYAPTVIVQNAGLVNVAGVQQNHSTFSGADAEPQALEMSRAVATAATPGQTTCLESQMDSGG
jgi:hypothetical protein